MARVLVRIVVFLLLAPAGALAQGVTIDHKEIGCIVAGKYPKMNACFAPASMVKKPRVYFRPEMLTDWYYVEMTSDAPCHSGVLLRPNKALIGKTIFYYVDAQGGSARTPEYAPVVVASAEECKTKLPVAPLSATGPVAVFPSAPGVGFIVGGGASAGVVTGGVAAVGLVAGGTVLLTNDDPKTNPTLGTVPATTPQATTPSAPPPPVPPPPALVVACQAAPRNGEVPLRVDFATFPAGGTGSYEFQWSFGDGAESPNPNPAHTYTTPGTFAATVRVSSGGQIVACTRSITATAPPPTGPAPVPGPFTLSVSLTGSGSGQVNGPGITCGADCTEAYASGTVVTLTATPDAASTFIGWSGACSGAGACTVTMNANKSVTAKFEPKTVVLTVTTTGTGTGTVSGSGIACGADCTEPYPVGQLVTLTATPAGSSTFGGWGGAAPASCLGAPAPTTCSVTMDASKTVTARFDPPLPGPFTLTVTLTGLGTGAVTSTPLGIGCPGDCTEPYANGTVVTLTATPTARTSTFGGWGGAAPASCLGAPAPTTCDVTMDVSKTVTARFDTPPPVFHTLTVTGGKSSNINGSVNSDLPGITCNWTPPATCTDTATFSDGVSVILTGAPAGTVIWSGCTVNPPGDTCTVLMDADKFVDVDTFFLPAARGPSPAVPVVLSTVLEVPDGEGQVVMNGRSASAVRPGVAAIAAEGRRGANRVEAVLARGAGRSGTWRFDFSGLAAFKPGSLRVVAGTVAVITPDAVVFRLQGKPGERVVFTFEVED